MMPVAVLRERPKVPGATMPPERRGILRDGVRLLVSRPAGDEHRTFTDLPSALKPGDLLVVNESATLAASLPARGPTGPFRLNLSTSYGRNVWLAEPRRSFDRPGPVGLSEGDLVEIGGIPARALGPYPGLERLWFFHAAAPLAGAMERVGEPIRYGYADGSFPLDDYQTIFARVPGSAEMPSAARPFTKRVLASLADRGVGLASIVLHAGVSSLELGDAARDEILFYPEPFQVPRSTVDAIQSTRAAGHRVVAVGTTVIRALESAWECSGPRPTSGFTRLVLAPGHPIRSVDGLITGFHEAQSTHLWLLAALVGAERIRGAYAEALRAGYLWHEFGDSHLIWAG
jgi:S-adenosylmethionine:tRNA ribosyltransferase-isomerase